MGLPAPRLRDLAAWMKDENSRQKMDTKEVWEIGVPAKKSLPWSIVLSVLLSDSNDSFSNILRKLTGTEAEAKEIKGKKKLSLGKVNPAEIKKKLSSFNPFKNRHSFYHLKEISEIVRIFDLRLKRHANTLKSKNTVWNDDLKLKAVSSLLACTINVYFSDEIETGKFISYQETPGNSATKLVLFQYENQLHGKREDPINIFNFAVELHRAHNLKLDALRHFLKKAKILNMSTDKVIKLMNNPEVHGKAFLPTIMENNCFDVLEEVYRSPYIAFKLSEAGFETNPIESVAGNPSPLCYAIICSKNEKHLQILYDYASNCRCLFDRSVRRADETVLENLKLIKSVFENDISKVSLCSFEKCVVERVTDVLKQLNRFVEYQINIASNLRELKNTFKKTDAEAEEQIKKVREQNKLKETEEEKQIKKSRKENKFQYRKKIVESILEHYLKYFHYGAEKSRNISEQLTDFMNFTEYYDYTDSFSYISFFDNFYKLKLWFGLKDEDNVLDVEWKIFLAMMSNKYFPMNREKSSNVLRHIPLLHRKAVKSESKQLFEILRRTLSLDICKSDEELSKASHSLPQVIDELVIARLNKYMQAVQEVSPRDDGKKAVLVIERAMQVIGESIKPPSSMGSIVSFLLRSCLSSSLQEELIDIRNDLSKYRSNSVYGKLNVEEDNIVFEEIKEELKKMQEAFKTVSFTQSLRTEESVMYNCLNQLKSNLEPGAYGEFERQYELRLSERRREYEQHHRKCLELLLDSLSDLHGQSKKTTEKTTEKTIENTDKRKYVWLIKMREHLFGQLKSIEFLLTFIRRNKPEKYLDKLLNDVQCFCKVNKEKQDDEINKLINNDEELKKMKSNGKELVEMVNKDQKLKDIATRQIEELEKELGNFLPKWKGEILKHNHNKGVALSAPKIQSIFKSLKDNMFSSEDIAKINEAVKIALQEATDAKSELQGMFNKKACESDQRVEELLHKILIPSDTLTKIRGCYDRYPQTALKYLEKPISETNIKSDVNKMITDGSFIGGYPATILTKIVFQRRLDSKFYTSPKLPENICEKLEDFLMKKLKLLLNRLEIVKNILIDEDEEILATWKWGRSEAIKYHLKFLMRQRYMRDMSVRSALEMAFFDCVNIFHVKPKKGELEMDVSNDSLRSLYEKSTDLFAGIDLRNIVSHSAIPETVGEILDEDDFPSEMIEKLLQLIDDSKAIEAMLKLFQESGVLEKNDFVDGIEKSKFPERLLKTVTECCRWKKYIFLFPLITT